ncbi:hypothetical protein [Sorangium sp. So ce385]|uniref:hypothetical protein n=1 Tax=Sorangium sp. So ce385 TaxID=3133308 RepID=UPI003F5CA57F
MIVRTALLSLFTFLAGAAAFEPLARADESCRALVQDRVSRIYGQLGWEIDMTIHRDGVRQVTHSRGWLKRTDGGALVGRADQLFSDRTSAADPDQQFDAESADELTIDVSPTGVLHIRYFPWRFDTSWDMACQGPVMTRYIPGIGVVTLTFHQNITIPF